MPLTILFSARDDDWHEYRDLLPDALARAGLEARVTRQAEDPATVDYIVYAPSGGMSDFAPFTGAKAVLSLWAGVEKIVGNPTLTQPLMRMVDPVGLTEGMVEWVTGHVLRHHLGMDAHILAAPGSWDQTCPPLARDRRVCVLGLGVLGAACAKALASLNFRVSGWSRGQRTVPGVTCHSGPDGLAAALDGAEMVVLLLPQTPQTDGLMNTARLAALPRGAVILNPGRGPLIDDAALLAALDSGQIGHATLDVFRTEPLPADHPFWSHPHVTVTPHVASTTRPTTAAPCLADSIARLETGAPVDGLVDRARGY
ncbi:glyoxylate/hydroxypyruvate reductase A [Meridianimarinicoccus roseus]|uniref:Glyoxylate/hydroxypyruvate reductase A n=1 Tax=Meridianimarinicoccus roseus TaxID=2072018 RepID=A0A2V2LIL9_9RHOB|nr:glyoxylate/hydroxypyruvate reductase A [Meridianimarinicoccus roseus]PWR02269.1 glyoxylate/hydroxypyruvate reductase A [Meridianimarinicoccus roseus]